MTVNLAARNSSADGKAAAHHRSAAAAPALHEHEFEQFRSLIYRTAGISMSPAKKPLVAGRLAKRLRHHGIASFGEYYSFISSPQNSIELQTAVDLLTTNETHFFREPRHFDFLREKVLPAYRPGRPFRVWSAASSSGEEAYTIAMVLADALGGSPWEILGSDISTHVLGKARQALYSMERAEEIPRHYLSRFCLKGTGRFDGSFMIERPLRERVRFTQVNLVEPLPDVGEFDVIFLRNVMIYFDQDTKRGVVGRLEKALRPGGHLLIGHSESLNGVTDSLKSIAPSIYQKV